VADTVAGPITTAGTGTVVLHLASAPEETGWDASETAPGWVARGLPDRTWLTSTLPAQPDAHQAPLTVTGSPTVHDVALSDSGRGGTELVVVVGAAAMGVVEATVDGAKDGIGGGE
jgi:hypothetical protein